ncbi:MAG: hypothetical protein JW818_02945 [Pirellulales bacterium]|nr:hypothetical protein [Pirellulales bacterium]
MKPDSPDIPKPVLNWADGIDIENIEDWVPDDPANASVWIAVTIGPDSTCGHDFQIHVCTPNAARNLQDKKGLLIVPYYENWASVLEALDRGLDECCGFTWDEMCAKLAKRFLWEYQ